MHSGLKFITPHQRHTRVDEGIMEGRHSIYLQAKERHPERWSGKTRNWRLPHVVALNANRKKRMAQTREQRELEAIV